MKTISSFIATFLVIISLNAQDSKINIGLNGGAVVGGLDSMFSSTFASEVNALFPVSKHFYIGSSISYYYVNGKNITVRVERRKPGIIPKYEVTYEKAKVESIGIMPLSGAFRVYFLKHFSIGADVGYAFFFNSSLNNNIYYRPVLSANITKNIGIQASFSGVSDIFMFVTGGIVFTI